MAKLQRLLRENPLTLTEIAAKLKITTKEVRVELEDLADQHIKVHKKGHKYYTTLVSIKKKNSDYTSRDDNTYVFGATGDWHMASKYERVDVVHSLYKTFEDMGCDRVFHTGNYVDGHARFNTHDLKAIGLDAQLHYLANNYPFTYLDTYAVSGDDHEGWWAKKDGIDIGAYAQRFLHDEGIDHWHDLGYMEAFVNLKNKNSGKKSDILVCHPGGGSSYAHSYRPQKIIGSYDPEELPGVALFGHYHKLSYNYIRGVHVIQTGCAQDQTPFMRKMLINAQVGGVVVQLTQDPKTGRITSCTQRFLFFNVREKINNRWSMSHAVDLPIRST